MSLLNPGVDFPDLVRQEVARARLLFPAIRSEHEGVAIIEEEFLEMRETVFKKRPGEFRENRLAGMLQELVQLAAMCHRTAEDLELMAFWRG